MEYSVIHYDEYCFGHITVNARGDVDLSFSRRIDGGTRGKDAYFLVNDQGYIEQYYAHHTQFNRANPGESLFVAKGSKIPRDLLRNSGYKIVLDYNNADKIVIPQLYPPYSFTTELLALAKCGEKSVLFDLSVNRSYIYMDKPWTREEADNILKKATQEINKSIPDEIQFYFNETDGLFFRPFRVSFLKKEPMYELFFNDKFALHRFVSDINIPILTGTKIDLETLDLWRRGKDENIFEKNLLNSNWQEYPFSINILLEETKANFRNQGAFGALLSAVDYNSFTFGTPERWGRNRTVTAKDWNLAQQFMMLLIGVDPKKGGYVKDGYRFFSTRERYKCIRRKLAVKPLFIDEDMPFLQAYGMLIN